MHYTSWDRKDTAVPRLLADGGSTLLAVFRTKDAVAEVGDEKWQLSVDDALGASATLPDGSVFRLVGKLAKDKELTASVDGRTYSFINESGSNWIIDNARSEKVAQFSGRNHGVREAIVEFEAENDLPQNDVIALSWFARTVLERRLRKSNNIFLAVFILLALIAVVAFLI